MKHSLEFCPNCGAIWAPGSEEWDWQQCDACGWSDNEEDYDDDDDNYEPEPHTDDHGIETKYEFRDRMAEYQKLK